MALPNPSMSFSPFAILTAEELNDIVENVEYLETKPVTNSMLDTSSGEIGGSWSTWSPTLTGFSSVPAGAFYRYKKVGKICIIQITQPNNGTSNSNAFNISLPFQAANVGTGMEWRTTFAQPVNNSATETSSPGIAIISNNATEVVLYRTLSGNLWTNANGKRAPGLTMIYETV